MIFFNDILAKASSVQVNIVVSGSAHRLLDSVISSNKSYQALALRYQLLSHGPVLDACLSSELEISCCKLEIGVDCNPLDCNGFWRGICHVSYVRHL